MDEEGAEELFSLKDGGGSVLRWLVDDSERRVGWRGIGANEEDMVGETKKGCRSRSRGERRRSGGVVGWYEKKSYKVMGGGE